MKKKIFIKEIEPIELVFRDKSLVFMLNNEALILFTETYGDVSIVMQEDKSKPYDFAAKLLYCGIKCNNADFEYEEAASIIASGGLPLVIDIFESFAESFISNATDEEMKVYEGELLRLSQSMK